MEHGFGHFGRGGEFARGPQQMARHHHHGREHSGRDREVKPENVTVSGTLRLVNGHIAAVRDSKTWYPVNLDHLAGFIDGFKEGAEVLLEGAAFPLPGSDDSFRFFAAKLTLNGRDWSFGGRKQEQPE